MDAGASAVLILFGAANRFPEQRESDKIEVIVNRWAITLVMCWDIMGF